MTKTDRINLIRGLAEQVGNCPRERSILMTLCGAMRDGDKTLNSLSETVDAWRNEVGVPALKARLGMARTKLEALGNWARDKTVSG